MRRRMWMVGVAVIGVSVVGAATGAAQPRPASEAVTQRWMAALDHRGIRVELADDQPDSDPATAEELLGSAFSVPEPGEFVGLWRGWVTRGGPKADIQHQDMWVVAFDGVYQPSFGPGSIAAEADGQMYVLIDVETGRMRWSGAF